MSMSMPVPVPAARSSLSIVVPALDEAGSIESVVISPSATGTPVSSCTEASPLVASPAT